MWAYVRDVLARAVEKTLGSYGQSWETLSVSLLSVVIPALIYWCRVRYRAGGVKALFTLPSDWRQTVHDVSFSVVCGVICLGLIFLFNVARSARDKESDAVARANTEAANAQLLAQLAEERAERYKAKADAWESIHVQAMRPPMPEPIRLGAGMTAVPWHGLFSDHPQFENAMKVSFYNQAGGGGSPELEITLDGPDGAVMVNRPVYEQKQTGATLTLSGYAPIAQETPMDVTIYSKEPRRFLGVKVTR